MTYKTKDKILRSHIMLLTEEQQKHPSETALDDTVPDITLHNPGQFNEYKEILLGILTSIIERGNKDD